MAWKYILKRLLLMIPTLLAVILIAFFLKNAVPGDPVETILINRGFSYDNVDDKQKEYKRIYQTEGFNKPLFYFSILPSHYPGDVYSILEKDERNNMTSLLKQGYLPDDIRVYFSENNRILQKLKDSVDSKVNTRFWQQTLTFHPSPDALLSVIKHYQEEADYLFSDQVRFLEKMEARRVSLFLPAFHWYGTQNQFHIYLSRVLCFDLGVSAKDGKKVGHKIMDSLRWTSTMIGLSMVVLLFISIPLGLFSGRFEGSLLDKVTEKISVFLYAIPVFWLASLLIIFCTTDQYSKWLNIFPSVKTWYDLRGQGFIMNVWSHSKQLILPVICMVANDFAFLIKLIRDNTIHEKNQTYVKVAIAKGLPDKQVLFRHVLPNVGIHILAVIIGLIPAAFAGSLIVEVIFNIPGMGRLLYNSITSSDWNVVFGILILLASVTLIFNLLGDMLIARLHPKIRYDA